jgi:hypothetical protein
LLFSASSPPPPLAPRFFVRFYVVVFLDVFYKGIKKNAIKKIAGNFPAAAKKSSYTYSLELHLHRGFIFTAGPCALRRAAQQLLRHGAAESDCADCGVGTQARES